MTKKNTTTKIAALIALIAILSSIIGTGILIIYETYFSSNSIEKDAIMQEQLQELLNNNSGSLSNTGKINE